MLVGAVTNMGIRHLKEMFLLFGGVVDADQ